MRSAGVSMSSLPLDFTNTSRHCRHATSQTRWRRKVLAVVGACCVMASCGPAQNVTTQTSGGAPKPFRDISQVPVSTGQASNTEAVSVIQPSQGDLKSLGETFRQYEALPATCTTETVPGTVHVAKVKANGVSWAIAGFKPAPSCRVLNDGQLVPAGATGPFGEIPQPPVGVFERQPGGQWTMNSEAGKPFPCAPPASQVPGAGNSAVPEEVLTALKIPYAAQGCHTTTPPAPR